MGNRNQPVICKNCGCECRSNFCPDCGQSVAEKRLENKSFFLGFVSGLTRIDRGFLVTAWQLLVNPWRVIRDYIGCRRVKYVPPVKMLIVMCFLFTIVIGLISTDTDSNIMEADISGKPLFYRVVLYVWNYFMSNALAQNLTFYIPALLAIPIVYGRKGAKRYNTAEYFAAMIYMVNAFLVFGTLSSPFLFVSEEWYSSINMIYTVVISCLALFIAFPFANLKIRLGYFLLYVLSVILIYLIIIIPVILLFKDYI